MAQIGPRSHASTLYAVLALALLAPWLPACLDRGTTNPPDAMVEPDAAVDAGTDAGTDAGDEPEPEVYVEVGIPNPETNTGWVPLATDGEVQVDTFGQGGYHAEVSIGFRGFGDEIYPQIIILNMDGDGIVDTPLPPRPQPVACDDSGWCTDSRIFVMLGGLADIEELDGLRVRIIAVVTNDAGLRGEDARDVVLRMVQR